MCKMIAISERDKDKYGCPYCGCDLAILGNFYGRGAAPVKCEECGKDYVILANGMDECPYKIGNGDGNIQQPKLQKHPREGTPWHPYEWPDPRPEDGEGEFCNPRGIGYDMACFVKSKKAGERLKEMVLEVLGKDESTSWLDYRKHEPKWIQFKFQKEEFDLQKLEKAILDNDKVVTKQILMDCKII